MKFSSTLVSLTVALLGVTGSLADDPASDPYSCSATSPCAIGCCGKNNVCGLGPDYCSAENCISTCDAKSDCDPGWGSEWSSKEDCPLNVCCSKFGFCGTTSEFCGTETVKSPSCSGNTASQRIIGYYEGWSSTRDCKGLNPEDILVGAYTHLNYAFAFVDPTSFAVAPMQESDLDFYPRFTALKQANPGLETWISIGGWSMNDPDQPTATTFSDLAGSDDAQSKFFKSLVNFMSTHGFDGVDIDWEYPVAPERSGKPADYENYVSFLKNLKNALGSGGHNYGLTITLPSSYWYMQNFDIKSMESIVSWFNVMTYDLHGTWDSTDPYIGPVINAHTNLTEIDMTLDLLWRNDIDPAKVSMGMGFYGRSFTLSDPSCTAAGCPFSAGGTPGPCSASAGTLMYSEIEDIIAAGATVTEDKDAAVAIVTWDNDQWVSYDNTNTLKQKLDYANGKCLGGIMIWAGSTDDASGSAILSLNDAAGRSSFTTAQLKATKDPIGQCVWGECNANCPSGYTPATGTGGKQSGLAGIFNGCSNGESRYYCCPTGNVPTCRWKGSLTWCGFTASGRCNDQEVEVTTSTTGAGGGTCWEGHKSLCCDKTTSTSGVDDCAWSGSAPFCTTSTALTLGNPLLFFTSASCADGYPDKLTTGKYGYGGDQPCGYNFGFKSYCCKDPIPYENCAWHQGRANKWTEWLNAFDLNILPVFGQDCQGQCPDGQVPIATDGTNCRSGTYSYFCCDNPNAPALPAPQDVLSCPNPANGISENPSKDTISPPDYIESEAYDQDCTLYKDPSATKIKRGADWDRQVEWSKIVALNASASFIGPRSLEKRGTQDVAAALKLCWNGQSSTLLPQTYSRANTIAGLPGRGFISGISTLSCGALGVVAWGARQAGVEYVTEHVFEKQQFRNAIQWMLNGQTPGGGVLGAAAATWNGVFDQTGIFFQNWPANLQQAFGATPMDTAFGILGRTAGNGAANTDNLQVFDRFLNGIKAHIVSGDSFVGTATFNAYNDDNKLAILADLVDVFKYYGLPAVKTSFSTTFLALKDFWGDFATFSTSTAGINYDYATAFEDVIIADLNSEVSTTRTLFNNLVTQQTTYWASTAALFAHGQATVTQAQATLADYALNVNNYITLDVTAMTT